MIDRIISKKDNLNSEIKRKSREYEKEFRPALKSKLHTELKILEGEYKACVEIIRMLED